VRLYFSLLLSLLLVCSLEKNPGIPDGEVIVQVIDQSGVMEKNYSVENVENAQVILTSLNYQIEYQMTSDTNGLAYFQKVIPDFYYCSIEREITEQEAENYLGYQESGILLKNSSSQLIKIAMEKDTVYQISVDIAISNRGLLISEIYACGAAEAGRYYHDKYVEVFNQSDSIVYLDSLYVIQVRENASGDRENYVYTNNIWYVPGNGTDFPLDPGEFAVFAEDAIDHRNSAPLSVDLSHVKFEFYKEDSGKDIDNPDVVNMCLLYQAAGFDWLIGGEKDAIAIAKVNPDSLVFEKQFYRVPVLDVIDAVEYLESSDDLPEKILPERLDAGATGGIVFYTGKSMERKMIKKNGRIYLKDSDNSSLDFKVIEHPTPESHFSLEDE